MQFAPLPPVGVACRASDTRHATLVGYARVFARPSDLADECARLSLMGCASVFSDDCRGAYPFRPGLADAFAALAPGDCLVVESLERISWRFEDLAQAIADLGSRGISLAALTEGLDTRSGDDAFSAFRAASAYFESVRVIRVAEAKRANPRQKGVPRVVASVRERIDSGELSTAEAARQLGVHRSTLYRRAALEAQA